METVDRIIFECIDAAFSCYRIVHKEAFYQLLESSCGVSVEHLSSNYDTFHEALKNQLGTKHFKVERMILRILKERTKEGIYCHTDEIEAFNVITNSLIKDTNRELQEIRVFQSSEDELIKELKKKVAEQDDRLRNTTRMAAIGETASMVGHDIRNPLQSITGELYLLGNEVKNMPDGEGKQAMQESLEIIEENLLYINKIILDLQDYARPLIPEMTRVNMADLLSSTLKTIKIPDNIKLNVETNSD
ncbi:MAG TPA: histidine kinase dimerization/phospho-acceptor domain-containing protein, partial [Candidatus Limnocylindrales bacterium]|nr:histidine kinase dimerization/phospho-acceptor domain-containing protein [Candidatus Limnocylindrales bacterium]